MPKTKVADSPQSMEELLTIAKERVVPFRVGDMTPVTILHKSRQRILVDVAGVTLGIIPTKEFSFDVDELAEGMKTVALVLAGENKDGYTVLSLKRADRERLWQLMEEKMRSGIPIKVKIMAANRGGLMAEYATIEGFMPVSQLSAEHYPKVEGGDSQEIFNRLRHFVGQVLTVKIINVDKANNKLIFSEKAISDDELTELLKVVKIGQVFPGTVTGVVDFGLFVKVPCGDGHLEGLVHLSEIAWDRVDNIYALFKVGQSIDVMVIGVEKTKLSLSIKRLKPDPWQIIPKKYQVGDQTTGEVTRITPYGAFIHLPDGIEGLVHLSELPIKGKEDINKVLTVGQQYQFTVLAIEPAKRKINLTMKESVRPKVKSVKKKATSSKKIARHKADDNSIKSQ